MIQKVDSVTPSFKEENSDRYNIYGTDILGTVSNISAYSIAGWEDPNWPSYSTSHLATHVNFYGKLSYNIINNQYPKGLIGTAFEDLVSSVNNDGLVVLDINGSNYRTNFDGTFAIKVPLDSTYSGMTSGLSETILYTSYIWDPNCLNLAGGLCAGTESDKKRSESNSRYTANLLGIGNPVVDGINPKQGEFFNSRIAFLMSDDVYYTFTGSTGTSISWGYQFGVDSQFAKGRRLINTDLTNTQYVGFYDRVQGFVDLNEGLVFLWGPTAQAFDWTKFSGNMYTTGATPTTSGATIIDASDWDYQVGVDVRVIIQPDMYDTTSNPSIIGQKNCDTVFSRICFFDKNGGLLAQGVANKPIELTGSYVPVEVFLPTSGVIGDTSHRTYSDPL